VGYRELLQALDEEVAREVQAIRDAAAEECRQLMDAARAGSLAKREQALQEERLRLGEAAARAVAKARLEQQHALLGEMRARLDELGAEAEARLASVGHGDVDARLFDEVVPELGEGPLELCVAPGREEPLRRHLEKSHPALLARARIAGRPEVRGGVLVSLDGRALLDNTLPSRLRAAWQLLEPELAGFLFGDAAAPGGADAGA
jgi:vacuolar-type H+-ATPase subunit E/Vma4